MAYAWPKETLYHELRSLKRYIQLFPDAPVEVRAHHPEGVFQRPSIVLSVNSISREPLGQHLVTLVRTGTVTWYGSEEVEEGAWATASWLPMALTAGHGPLGGRGAIRIYDYSVTPSVATNSVMEIETAQAAVIRDAMNRWVVPVDVRWSVRMGRQDADTLTPTTIPVTTVNEITWVPQVPSLEPPD